MAGYKRLSVTPSEMLEMRKQGMSNQDIAGALDICKRTVNRYIGAQGHKMETLKAFKEPPKAKPDIVSPAPAPIEKSEKLKENRIILPGNLIASAITVKSGDLEAEIQLNDRMIHLKYKPNKEVGLDYEGIFKFEDFDSFLTDFLQVRNFLFTNDINTKE